MKDSRKSSFARVLFALLLVAVLCLLAACAAEPQTPAAPPQGGDPSDATPLPVIEGVTFTEDSFTFAYTGASVEQEIKDSIENLPQGATVQLEGLPSDFAAGTYTLTVKISLDGYQTLTKSVTLVITPADYAFDGVSFGDATLAYTGEPIAIPAVQGTLPAYVSVTYTSEPAEIRDEGTYTVTAHFTSTDPSIVLSQESMSATLTVKRRFTVTVELGGGTGCESTYTVWNGDHLTLSEPQRDDYRFMGWTKGGNSFDLSSPITESFTLVAAWEPVKYNINYVFNAQSLTVDNGTNPAYYTHLDGTLTLQAPTCTGLQFVGWYADIGLTVPITEISASRKEPITVYAKWTGIPFTVQYVMNGGTNNTQNPATYTVLDNFELYNPEYRADYTFEGWYSDSAFQNRVTVLGAQATNLTLYAKWEARKYTVSYTLNGGTNNSQNPRNYTHLDGIITLYDPTRAGFEFDGWYLESNFETRAFNIDASERKTVRLYAKWIEPDVVFTIVPIDSNTATLTAVKAKSTIFAVEIPATYGGYTITAIGESAFNNSKHVTAVTIPSTVTSIGASAFRYTKITAIRIPSSVTSVGNYAFANCTALSDVTWSTKAEKIMPYVFMGCTGLTSMEIPSNVTYIGMQSFKGSGLTEITVPDSVINIMDGAFENTPLKKAVIGKNVAYMEGIFVGCNQLEELTVPFVGSNLNTGWNKSCLYQIFYRSSTNNERPDAKKNQTYVPASLKKLTVTNTKKLTIDALRYCANLEQIILPEGLTEIGDCALEGCNNVLSFTLPSTVTTVTGGTPFYTNGGFVELYNLSALSVQDIGGISRNLLAVHTSATAPSIIQTIGEYKFAVVDGVYTLVKYVGSDTAITLPTLEGGKTYTVGNCAFYGNTSITAVTMPNGVTAIGEFAFRNCSALASVTFPPTSLLTIGAYAFNGTALVSVVIPDSVTEMGQEVFGVTALTNTTLKSVVLGNGLTAVPYRAFYNCTGLETVTFGANIVTVENDAFSSCSGIKEIVLNAKVQTIKSGAFAYCRSLTHIKLSESLTSIAYDAFTSCNIKEIWNPSALVLTAGATDNGYIAQNATVIHNNLTDEKEVLS